MSKLVKATARAEVFTVGAPSAIVAMEDPKMNEFQSWVGDHRHTIWSDMSTLWVDFVAGADAPYLGVVLGEGVHRELELLVEAGLTPLEAISAATANAAALMKADDWGVIEPGRRADRVVVEGRLPRDIGATRNIRLIMRWILARNKLKFDPATDPGFGVGAPVSAN